MSDICSAIIGLGRIASLLEDDPLREKPCTHAGAITASKDCFLAGGMDCSSERRDLFAKKWGCPVFDNAEDMLKSVKPQILHIATHPETHLQFCLLAARYGVPVIVCEKPLAHTLTGAKKIAAIAGRGTKIIVNHERRYARDYQNIKNLVASGELGALCSIAGTLYMGKDRRLLDILWHDGTHMADCLAFLSGGMLHHKKTVGSPLTGITGSAFLIGDIIGIKNAASECSAPKSPAFAKTNIPFSIEIGAGRDHIVFEIEISLTQGRLRIGNGVYEVYKSTESPYAKGFRALACVQSGFSEPSGYFSHMVEDAVKLVHDEKGSAEPLSSARDALGVIAYLSAVARWKRQKKVHEAQKTSAAGNKKN
jgi:predicted dehydrogenase